ncbi:hypothetical protein IHE44_0011391 [Lamprotornis superbus]|uniref:Uncharacterized protein n=1 Tax=Lamprotornis superbus TaxID=245042 RepID=A0A835NIZ3_9PASS|nr:hypothetical protein IHE44_0011391 [Lamprotornis superbus]
MYLERVVNKPLLIMSRATDATCNIQKFQTLEKQVLSLYGNTAFLSGRGNRHPLLKKPRLRLRIHPFIKAENVTSRWSTAGEQFAISIDCRSQSITVVFLCFFHKICFILLTCFITFLHYLPPSCLEPEAISFNNVMLESKLLFRFRKHATIVTLIREGKFTFIYCFFTPSVIIREKLRWEIGNWSTCSLTCGVGLQTRDVFCSHLLSRETNETVILADELCSKPKPSLVQGCNRFDCPPSWYPTEWQEEENSTKNVLLYLLSSASVQMRTHTTPSLSRLLKGFPTHREMKGPSGRCLPHPREVEFVMLFRTLIQSGLVQTHIHKKKKKTKTNNNNKKENDHRKI